MPRITKAHMKESIVSFANDAIQIIHENLNLNDIINREDKPIIESNGWYYYIHKSVTNIKPEIRIRRQNYRQGNTQYFTPLRICNGTPLAKQSVQLEIQGQQLPINELNGTPLKGACPISNLHRYKDQLKGYRINEEAWIYKEGMNCVFGKDYGFLIDGFSVQDYSKKAF